VIGKLIMTSVQNSAEKRRRCAFSRIDTSE